MILQYEHASEPLHISVKCILSASRQQTGHILQRLPKARPLASASSASREYRNRSDTSVHVSGNRARSRQHYPENARVCVSIVRIACASQSPGGADQTRPSASHETTRFRVSIVSIATDIASALQHGTPRSGECGTYKTVEARFWP